MSKVLGLKAQFITAWGNAPGIETQKCPGLKARSMHGCGAQKYG